MRASSRWGTATGPMTPVRRDTPVSNGLCLPGLTMGEYIKPTLDTKFHIDFDWWQEQGRNLATYLISRLCADCKQKHREDESELIDWVDPYSGEVRRLPALWETIRSCCSQRPDYITPETPLTYAVFLTFVAHDNKPLTPVELYEELRYRPASTILRTLAGHEIYYGIRPVRSPIVRIKRKAA